MAEDDWYCRSSGETSGPFSAEELGFLRDRGKHLQGVFPKLSRKTHFSSSLVGQRHFVASFCRKLYLRTVVCHGDSVSGRQDLIRVMSIPMAIRRAILVFVWDTRACLFRCW